MFIKDNIAINLFIHYTDNLQETNDDGIPSIHYTVDMEIPYSEHSIADTASFIVEDNREEWRGDNEEEETDNTANLSTRYFLEMKELKIAYLRNQIVEVENGKHDDLIRREIQDAVILSYDAKTKYKF